MSSILFRQVGTFIALGKVMESGNTALFKKTLGKDAPKVSTEVMVSTVVFYQEN